jgi:hypothetical protein
MDKATDVDGDIFRWVSKPVGESGETIMEEMCKRCSIHMIAE